MNYRHVSTLLGTYVLIDRPDLPRVDGKIPVDNITLGVRAIEGADLPPRTEQMIDVLDTPTMVQHVLQLAIAAVAKG
jgi:hypothetical protein